MRHALSVLAVVSLLALLAPAGAVAVGGASGASTPAAADVAAEPPSDPTLTMAVHLRADGDARWRVVARYPLNDSAERDAFRSLARDFEAGRLDGGLSADVFRAAVAAAEPHVNRSMAIERVDRSARVTDTEGSNATGVLRLSFTWTNFANASNGQLRVGDAFAGGWFGDLAADQTLLVYPPEGYTVQSVSPSTRFQQGALQWQGPRDFETGPQVRLAASSAPPVPLLPALAAVLAALVLGGLVVYFWYGPRSGREQASEETGATEAQPTAPGGEATPESGEAAGGATEEAAEAGTGAEAGTETGTEAEEAVDEELLSDEERVERLLKRNGGRMKQAKIVEETRWSNAKVSQLLSSMAEEGRVEKLRIGRENLISLPDAEAYESGEEE